MRTFLLATTIAAATTVGSTALAQDEMDQRFGKVHFATTCNEVAQRRFDRAMRYQHSFWYAESKEIYEEAIKADATCAIAYWGIALSLLNNPHSAIPAPNLPLGLAAIQKAKETGAKSERERDYIDALTVMYVDYDKIPQQARVQSYLKKMEALAAKYPDDDEAQIFYAITLNVAASPADSAALFEDRAECAARAAHAVAYLHPRRLLEGIDCGQYCFGGSRQGPRQRARRAIARRGLHGLRLSAIGARRKGAQGDRHHRGADAQSRLLRRRVFARCCACPLRARTRRLERCSQA